MVVVLFLMIQEIIPTLSSIVDGILVQGYEINITYDLKFIQGNHLKHNLIDTMFNGRRLESALFGDL